MDTKPFADYSILITGGAGFIGSQLAEKLVRNNEITIIDDLSVGEVTNTPKQAQVLVEDITERELISNDSLDVDVIFHQAGLVDVSRSIDAPRQSHTINVTGTLNVLDAARKYNARVVVASSAAIYGHPRYLPIDEHHPCNPVSPYGVDKLSADYYTQVYADLYDLKTICLRYFNVYGPGQIGGDYAGVIPVFIKQALSGEDITVHGDGEQTRDFVFIDDVVQANIAAAQTDHFGNAYNIGAGETVSIRELAELVQKLTDTTSDIVHLDSREGDIERSVADITKAETQLNYQPEIPLREGLKRTIDWWRQHKTG